MADITIDLSRAGHFLEAYETFWKQGSGHAGGMCGGVLGRGMEHSDRNLVTSFGDHDQSQQWNADMVLAEVKEDIQSAQETFIVLHDAWTVIS